MPPPHIFHLVCSIPLPTTAEVFETTASQLGPILHSVPDGEVAERKSFVQWQAPHIPAVVRKSLFGGTPTPGCPPVSLSLEDIHPLRYDDVAVESYREFVAARARGGFAPKARLQVCLPTPASVVRSLVEHAYCAQVEALYEVRLLQCLRKVQAEIPAHDLMIQGDMPIEMAMLELDRGELTDLFFVEFFRPYFAPVRAGILERFERLAREVRPGVEMGVHLCYGNFRQRHWLEPKSLELVVSLTNDLQGAMALHRPVDFVHMPVPKERNDVACVLPLADLGDLRTTVILGLIHAGDLEGTWERVRVAQRVCKVPFGVSTECGLTNKPLEYVQSVFEIASTVCGRAE
ncbi:hypothetical protein M409DRAFT_26452 [Zasmidium cellare ATCC 36951]|uniref:Cobalamin-independent methionine synthase MetE C-terminal/archaeal domain-containing protein n=1 Tax=Zasmidium cellare ATCC 36951 TaxID=1080233 RepID=A0A6A6C7B1_ZASCE|nr:uncharacterized protein M409DRAFT_26452 [Zasmidium cellare ATCC 36951]KAF2163004.1 hypothetical protein M409DRAFT_26452 [Zasmidium cellare ATCC 36951]